MTRLPRPVPPAGGPAGLFGFESDLYPALRCIPMSVRYKLDVVGLKVSLRAWSRLPAERRWELVREWPVDTEAARGQLREALLGWLAAVTDEPVPDLPGDAGPWADPGRVPEAVAELGGRCEPPLGAKEWGSLELLERVALVKLAASAHERGRFAAALEEFRRER